MARRKSATNVKINPWLSARQDCCEGRFSQIGNSLLLSEQFLELSVCARMIYIDMANEAGQSREFQFPLSCAKKYGIPSTTFWNKVLELEEHGFIEKVSGQNIRKPNIYRFAFTWKNGAG